MHKQNKLYITCLLFKIMTRMWMVNPKVLCRQHLLGEHKELHQLVGSLRKGKSINGHVEKGQVEIHNIKKRHEALVKELLRRGYKHQSTLKKFKSQKLGKINVLGNYAELEKRCKECRKLIKKSKK